MNTVIITAAGIGKRMNASVPKQFLPLGSTCVLGHTIQQFYLADQSLQVILTLPKDWIDFWKTWCGENEFDIPHEISAGGVERFDSIKIALEKAKGEFIAVHDGVRPLLSQDLIKKLFEEVKSKKAVIPVIDLKDSLRELDENTSKIVNRSKYKLVQTPQVFESKILKEAYQVEYTSLFTDDASVIESYGQYVYLIEGEEQNIKITTQQDLQFANYLLESQEN